MDEMEVFMRSPSMFVSSILISSLPSLSASPPWAPTTPCFRDPPCNGDKGDPGDDKRARDFMWLWASRSHSLALP